MRVRIDLDPETATALQERSKACLRPVDMQAEVLLRQALGIPIPHDAPTAEVVTAPKDEGAKC